MGGCQRAKSDERIALRRNKLQRHYMACDFLKAESKPGASNALRLPDFCESLFRTTYLEMTFGHRMYNPFAL